MSSAAGLRIRSHENKLNSCVSCLVIIDQDAKVCPFCGFDQARPVESVVPEPRPVEIVVLEPEKPREWASVVPPWAIATLAIVCSVGILLWYTLREPGLDRALQPEVIARKSILDIRSAMLEYALASGDKYPPTLESLGDPAARLVEAARNVGYEVSYTPQPSKTDGAIRSFVLLARTEKADGRNFYVDESGKMRATAENRPATIQDPPT